MKSTQGMPADHHVRVLPAAVYVGIIALCAAIAAWAGRTLLLELAEEGADVFPLLFICLGCAAGVIAGAIILSYLPSTGAVATLDDQGVTLHLKRQDRRFYPWSEFSAACICRMQTRAGYATRRFHYVCLIREFPGEARIGLSHSLLGFRNSRHVMTFCYPPFLGSWEETARAIRRLSGGRLDPLKNFVEGGGFNLANIDKFEDRLAGEFGEMENNWRISRLKPRPNGEPGDSDEK